MLEFWLLFADLSRLFLDKPNESLNNLSKTTHYIIMNEEIKYHELERKLSLTPPDEIEKVLSEIFVLFGIK